MATPVKGSPAARNQAARKAREGARQIREGRERGKAFLRKNPGAFGGGIDPETGVRRTSSGARSSVLSEAEKRAGATGPGLAQARARTRADAQAANTQKSQELVGALRAREQIAQEASDRGRGFTKTELKQRLRELGTNRQKLKEAARAAKEQFKRTGVSVREQIKAKAKLRRETREKAQAEIAERVARDRQPKPETPTVITRVKEPGENRFNNTNPRTPNAFTSDFRFTSPQTARLLQNKGVPLGTTRLEKIDAKLGGFLPGGPTPEAVRITKEEIRTGENAEIKTTIVKDAGVNRFNKVKDTLVNIIDPSPIPQKVLRQAAKDLTPPFIQAGKNLFKDNGKEGVSSVIQKAKDFRADIGAAGINALFGEKSKQLVGVQITPAKFITAQDVKTGLQEKGGTAGKVVAPLIPTTPGSAGLAVGALQVLTAAPPAVRVGLDAAFTPGEIKTAIDPTASKADRIRAGTFAALGLGGTALEGAPLVKGLTTRFKKGFRPVVVDEAVDTSRLFTAGKADIIKDIATTTDDTLDIRLIPEGKGFDFPISEQKEFIGKDATLTTSARDLFKEADLFDTAKSGTKNIGGPNLKDVKIESRETGDLGLFFTPTAGKGIGETRVSRLGLKDFLKPSGSDATIGFKIEEPQIAFVRDAPITATGAKGTARGVGFPSSELEATLLPGTSLEGQRVGSTTIKGQEVKIFESFIKTGGDPLAPPVNNIKGFSSSASPNQVVNPLGVGASTGRLSGSASITPIGTTTPTGSLTTPRLTTSTRVADANTISNILRTPITLSAPTITRSSGGSSRPRGGSGGSSPISPIPSIPSRPISPPTRAPSLPPSIPSLPPSIPSLIPSRPTRPTTRITTITPRPPRLPKIPSFKPQRAPKSQGGFGVQVRRGGVFRSIGNFKTQQGAFQAGKKRVGTTLAATFRLSGPGRTPGAPKGFRIKRTDLGNLFIEKRGRRLSTGSETREIKSAKGRTRKKKKKSKVKKK